MQQPDAIAIHYPRRKMFGKSEYAGCTYRELDQLSNDYARGLIEYGIGRGVRSADLIVGTAATPGDGATTSCSA